MASDSPSSERIRRGIERHWAPIIAKAAGNTYDGVNTGSNYLRVSDLDAPLQVQLGTSEHGIAIPLIVNNVSGSDEMRSRPVSDVLPGLVAGGNHASLLIPVEGREGKSAAAVVAPLRTQSTRNETGLLIPLRNHGVAKPTSHPIDTVSAEGNHHALVMRNNSGGAEMSAPVGEPLRTLTTGGHQSLIVPDYGPVTREGVFYGRWERSEP